MTAIAALIDKDGRVWMGGDSVGVEMGGGSLEQRLDPKVFVKTQGRKKFLIGFTTSFRMGQLLHYSFEIPPKPRGMDLLEYMSTRFVNAARECLKQGGFSRIDGNSEQGGSFIVGTEGRLFVIESDFQVGEPMASFAAVGGGSDLCKGSLHTTEEYGAQLDLNPSHRITMALKAAERFNCGVGGPFKIMCV
jgi:hypothetical protein